MVATHQLLASTLITKVTFLFSNFNHIQTSVDFSIHHTLCETHICHIPALPFYLRTGIASLLSHHKPFFKSADKFSFLPKSWTVLRLLLELPSLIFFLHHTHIDCLWWLWQQQGPEWSNSDYIGMPDPSQPFPAEHRSLDSGKASPIDQSSSMLMLFIELVKELILSVHHRLPEEIGRRSPDPSLRPRQPPNMHAQSHG